MMKKKPQISVILLLALVLLTSWNTLLGQEAPKGCAYVSKLIEVYDDERAVESTQYFDARDSLLREEALNYTYVLTYNQAGLLKSAISTNKQGEKKEWHHEYQGGKLKKTIRKFSDSPDVTLTYAYNSQGDLTEEKSQDESGKTFETRTFDYRYGKNGKWEERIETLLHHETQKTNTIETQIRTFDENGRVITFQSRGFEDDTDFVYRYNEAGILEFSSETTSGSQSTWNYDAKGRIKTEEIAFSAGEDSYDLQSTLTYKYDEKGRLIRREWLNTDGSRVELKEWEYTKCAR